MRVVVDTNVVVSRYLSALGPPAQVLDQWENGIFELLVSEPILTEYRRVLLYPRLAALHGMSATEIDTVITSFRGSSIVVAPTQVLAVVTDDPSDNRFLECAEEGGADYVVSGDAHLLAVGEYRGIQILRPAAFLAALRE
jgi:putative PIN family toxin of toxin-antitoxin system